MDATSQLTSNLDDSMGIVGSSLNKMQLHQIGKSGNKPDQRSNKFQNNKKVPIKGRPN